jgi:hypothetical protein
LSISFSRKGSGKGSLQLRKESAAAALFMPREAKIMALRGAYPPVTRALTAPISGVCTFQNPYFTLYTSNIITFLVIITKKYGLHNRQFSDLEG